jgi:putative flippase GtrA
MRYTGTAISFIVMAYILTKFFAWAIPLVPPPIANIFVNVITAIISYLTQKFYTFKTIKVEGVMMEEIIEEPVAEEV